MNGTVPVNPEAGEVALYAKSKSGEVLETFILHFGTNAVVRLETLLGEKDEHGNPKTVPIELLMPRLKAPGFSDIRAMIAAGLGDHHPNTTLEEAGNIADRVGIRAAAAAVGLALRIGFPDIFGTDGESAPVTEGKGRGRGTGNGSSKTRPKLVSAPLSSGN